MARAFGKIKRLIGKKNVSNSADSPTRPTNDALKPAVQPAAAEPTEPAAEVPAQDAGGNAQELTGADDVLDGILQDLNIKGGELAVPGNAERTDTVSEYSGGSAKSVESSESESSGSDEDSDEEEDSDDEYEKEKSAVDDRVATVMAAAEEIRKKRGSSRSPPVPSASASRSASRASAPSPATEPGSTGRNTPMGEQPPEQTSSKATWTSSKSKMSGSKASDKLSSKMSGSKTSDKSSKKNLFTKKPKSRSSSPQFSAEVSGKNKEAMSSIEKSFDTRDDDYNMTKDSQDSEEDRSYAGSKNGEEDTLAETLDTNGGSYEKGGDAPSMSESHAGESTFDEDEVANKKRTVMNKDIIIHQPGGPSSLVVRAMYYTPLPAHPDDIIIKVEASTVSFRDCLLRRDIGMEKVQFPFVPGCEVVGRISNIGKAARHEGYRIGDRVVGLTRKGGGNGFYAKLKTHNVAPIISSKIDAADAVCLVDVYMTAYQALRVGKKDGTPLTDANVLITDGFSPVGQAAVTLAKLEGANVYVTTTESRQDEYMRSLGVKCLPLAPSKWLNKLKGKMDIVIDNTCFDSYDSSWKALNSKGVLVCTGMTSIYSFQDFGGSGSGCCDAFGDLRDYQAKWAAMKARYMMSQTKFHDLWESFQNNPKKFQQELKYLCFLVENGTLKPKIAERVNIEEIPDAQRYLETGKANGTIVCLP